MAEAVVKTWPAASPPPMSSQHSACSKQNRSNLCAHKGGQMVTNLVLDLERLANQWSMATNLVLEWSNGHKPGARPRAPVEPA